MQSGAITDSHITASSMWDANHYPGRARLGITRVGSLVGSWSAKTNDVKQWIQIDLSRITRVTYVAIQGREDLDQWVTSYSLQYATHNGSHYIGYNGDQVFGGNFDQHTVVDHHLRPNIIARFIRILPKTWYKHISLRLEVYGCCCQGNKNTACHSPKVLFKKYGLLGSYN